jgi:hypothetical protein
MRQVDGKRNKLFCRHASLRPRSLDLVALYSDCTRTPTFENVSTGRQKKFQKKKKF